jgi:hypothetical protein
METMELLRVQGPKNNILAVGDYLSADGLFQSKKDDFDPVPRSTERYGVGLHVEFIFM